MNTPIYDFLLNNINSDYSRLHMPGHKGASLFDPHKGANLSNDKNENLSFPINSITAYDVTEITGADELYEAEGIIAQSENNTSSLYGTKHTSFSAGGSTLCIQAMINLVASDGDTIIAARNVHSSFINTCALLNITPYFVLPEFNDSFLVSGEITPVSIQKAIEKCPLAKAVYITSPDYLGCISNVKEIAKVCDKHNIPLVVDNAHGAHLKFMQNDIHPITLGATICCDSAHKTLPVLTGGAYLHVSKKSIITKQQVKTAMLMFGSTSPSYLILMSLDLNNKYLAENALKDFDKLQKTVEQTEKIALEKGFTSISENHDITKLTFNAFQVGLTGEQLKLHFKNYMIEPEYVSSQHVVLMISPYNTVKDINRIKNALININIDKPIISQSLKYTIPKSEISIRKALLGKKREVLIDNALGCIAAQAKIKCPPGVPIIIPGEVIDKQTQILLKKSSILTINVVE